MKYRSEIDGLRAIAVLPVIMFHADFSMFSGGFVGVDVFFVISGYLITTIILSEMEEDKFSIINFYERRARRILPALFLVMLVSLLFAWFWLMPSDMIDFSESLIAVSTFSSNILFWRESGYWDAASEMKPLLHTWSLAVEEQYYVLFPLFLLLMWRFRKRWILGSFMFVAAISLAAAQWGAYNKPTPTFYLLPTRGWELAIGAGIAFYFLYRKQTIKSLLSHKLIDEALGLLGLLLIGYAVIQFSEETPFPSLYALVPTIGAGLVILFSSTQTLVGKLLSTRPLVFIGLISYSAYLWHQPLFVFTRFMVYPEPGQWLYAALILATLVLAFLSWRFVETPFRNKKKFNRNAVFSLALIGSLVFIVIGAFGHFSGGFMQRGWYKDLFQYNYNADYRGLQQQSWKYLRELTKNDKYGVEGNEYDNQLWFDLNNRRKKLLLVGNSHSKDLYNVFINSNEVKSMFQIARYGVQIRDIASDGAKFYSSENYKKSDMIMIVSRYSKQDSRTLEQVVRMMINDKKKVAIVKNIFEFDFYSGKNIADMMLQRGLIKSLINGKLSTSGVAENIDKAYFMQFKSRDRREPCKESDSVIEAIAMNHKEVIVLDRMDYACDEEVNSCFSINDQLEKFYYDYGHHTLEGASFFGARVDQVHWLEKLR